MMHAGVSVIIVSHGRPKALMRAIRGVEQLFYPTVELVVVADKAGLEAAQSLEIPGKFKSVRFDEPNISMARNLGLAQAAGEIVAFLDDDAVPEPTWLDALVAPFDNAEVVAAGGFVRGRNGISWQWRARSVDRCGQSLPLDVDQTQTSLLTPTPERAIKTEGTNMAFRRDILANLGGFDPAFRFYLDETDVNLRLAAMGRPTAIVPQAEVHHGFAASPRRRSDRVPTSLFEIGASTAVFLRKHAPDQVDPQRRLLRSAQRQRLLRHMVSGRLEPRVVRRLLKGLETGFAEGLERQIEPLPPVAPKDPAFLPFETFPNTPVRVFWGGGRRALIGQAEAAVANRQRAMVLAFPPTSRFHRVSFLYSGVWLHAGGRFGRSVRSDPIWKFFTLAGRVSRELDRVRLQRRHEK